MKFNLKNLLFESFKKQKLSPFYIFRPGPQIANPRGALEAWLTDFLGETIAFNKAIPIEHAKDIVAQGHADILWPRREDETKNYNLKDGDLDELFSFMEYGSLELPWRFAVIEDPHKLSAAYSNKLLKTLEEPAKNTSIIFLDHNKTQFLDTIHSRAAQFIISDDSDSDKWKALPTKIDIEQWLNSRKKFYPLLLEKPEVYSLVKNYFETNKGIGELIEKLKYIKGSDREVAGIVVEYEADRPGRYSQKQQLCQELEWFEKSKVFNNAAWERSLGLLAVINS